MNRSSAGSTTLPFVPRYPLRARSLFVIAAANLLALFVLRADLLLSFNRDLIGGYSGDGGLYFWLFRLHAQSAHGWFDSNALFPYSLTVAWSDNFILPALYGRVFLTLGASPLAAYNATILSAMLLTGIATSALVYHLCGDLMSAKFSGVLFMGSAYLSGVIGHPQLEFAFWMPLALDCLFSFLHSRRARSAILFGLCIWGAFLTTVYFAIFSALLGAVLLIGVFLLRPAALSRAEWVRLAAFSALGSLPLAGLLPPYLAVQSTFGERHLYEPYFFSASLRSFLSSASQSLLYSWSAAWAPEEARFFSGFLPLALMIPLARRLGATPQLVKSGALFAALVVLCALFSAFERHRIFELAAALLSYAAIGAGGYFLMLLGRSERTLGAEYLTARSLAALLFFVAAIFLLLSLGPLGNPAEGDWAIGFYRLCYELIPGFSALRAICRIGILWLLASSLLAGLALHYLQKRTAHAPRWFALAYVIFLLENAVYPLTKEPIPPMPPIFAALAQRAAPRFVTISLPYSGALNEFKEIARWREFARINVSVMNWSLDSGLNTINGYSGQQTKLTKELPRALYNFPDARSIDALSAFAGLKYITYLPRFIENFSAQDFERKLEQFKGDLKVIEKDAEGNYLIERKGERSLDAEFSLLVPSRPHRNLMLQLRTKSVGIPQTVGILIDELFEQSPYYHITIDGDAMFHWYSLPLPAGESSVRPQRISFRGGEQILLGESLLEEVSQGGRTAQNTK